MDTWGFWEGWDDWNQEGLIESSALYHNRKQDIKWQTNGPQGFSGACCFIRWTGRPFTGVMWPLEAAASIHCPWLTGQCQTETNELEEGTRRGGSRPRGGTFHHSVNYQCGKLTQSRVNFTSRRDAPWSSSLLPATPASLHATPPVRHQGLAGFFELWVCPSSHMHTNKLMTATNK